MFGKQKKGASSKTKTKAKSFAVDDEVKPAPAEEYTSLIKAVMMGSERVGKTYFRARVTNNTSVDSEYRSTIGVDFATTMFDMGKDKRTKLQLWDQAGKQKYRAIGAAYTRGARMFLLFVDGLDATTIDDVRESVSAATPEDNAVFRVFITFLRSASDTSLEDPKAREAAEEEFSQKLSELQQDLAPYRTETITIQMEQFEDVEFIRSTMAAALADLDSENGGGAKGSRLNFKMVNGAGKTGTCSLNIKGDLSKPVPYSALRDAWAVDRIKRAGYRIEQGAGRGHITRFEDSFTVPQRCIDGAPCPVTLVHRPWFESGTCLEVKRDGAWHAAVISAVKPNGSTFDVEVKALEGASDGGWTQSVPADSAALAPIHTQEQLPLPKSYVLWEDMLTQERMPAASIDCFVTDSPAFWKT